jgi:hypothetical protein
MEQPSPSGDPKPDLLRSVAADKAVVGSQLPKREVGDSGNQYTKEADGTSTVCQTGRCVRLRL